MNKKILQFINQFSLIELFIYETRSNVLFKLCDVSNDNWTQCFASVKPTKIKKIKAVRLTIQYYQGDINKDEILLISHIKNNLVLKFEKKVVS